MTNDMTSGNPVKLIIRFMIPMCLGNIFQQFYNIADSIIAGQFLGVNALAAIGSTGSLIFLVVGWLTGLPAVFLSGYHSGLVQRRLTGCGILLLCPFISAQHSSLL